MAVIPSTDPGDTVKNTGARIEVAWGPQSWNDPINSCIFLWPHLTLYINPTNLAILLNAAFYPALDLFGFRMMPVAGKWDLSLKFGPHIQSDGGE